MALIAQGYCKEIDTYHEGIGQTILQVVGASLFIAICSQIKFDLPFTFVPLTLQTFAVLLVGAVLGSRKGFCALLCYFAEILMGLPVLAGGLANPLIFLGPKAGYYFGFSLQAFMMGWVVEKAPFSKSLTLLVGGLLACAIQMALGVSVLAQFVGWHLALPMGLFPFIPGEILKVLAVAFAMQRNRCKSLLQWPINLIQNH